MPTKTTPHPIYALRIELLDTEPLIWRECWIDGKMSLNKLHHVLQTVMGWEDSHLHEFELGGQRFKLPHPDDAFDEFPSLDSKKAKVNKVLEEGDEFIYIYDFGDNWHHRVCVTQVEWIDHVPMSIAQVTAGAMACPPEDVGGVGGLANMLSFLNSSDPNDQAEADSYRTWLGGDFNPSLFDQRSINAALTRMAFNGWGGK